MTSELFCEWLDILNNEMCLANRKIVLLIDNCAAHPHVERSNFKLVFFPANTTAKLQPCDAGIIQAVKLRYRTRLLRRIAFAIDRVESACSLAKKVTLFDAIMWLQHAFAKHDDTVTTSRDDTDDPAWEQTLIACAQNGFVSDGNEDDVVAAENEETEASESAVISAEEAARMVEELKSSVFITTNPKLLMRCLTSKEISNK